MSTAVGEASMCAMKTFLILNGTEIDAPVDDQSLIHI
jgi:prophage maintenance system killer protein